MDWIKAEPSFKKHPKRCSILYLARQFNIHPLIMQIIFDRGYQDDDQIFEFMFPTIKDMHDPFLFNDMKKTIKRIVRAIKEKEKIIIFGDYDVDGITSSALLYKALRHFKANVDFRLPLREEGYGITPSAIKKFPDNVALIITVDNGSSAHSAMEYAKMKGIDVIVTDHHEVLEKHPECLAFINPKRRDNRYPFEHLCGAGVALKVVEALFQVSKYQWEEFAWEFIELATLGTIADMMPLVGENRAICSLGIKKMNVNPNPVLKELFRFLKIEIVDSTSLGFQIAPLFNSCGRVGDPNKAANLLTKKDVDINGLKELIEMNRYRKNLTNEQYKLCEQTIFQQGLNKNNIIVVFDDFHHGIIGILASRITENFRKPSIVISHSGTGSARSVQGSNFSIIDAIRSGGQFLKRYGGHQAAAGLSIDTNLIEDFKNAVTKPSVISRSTPKIEFIEKVTFGQFSRHLHSDFHRLEPFGIGNKKPVFLSPSTYIDQVTFFGSENQYFKLISKDKVALSFKKNNLIKNKNYVDILYTANSIHKNLFNIYDVQLTEGKGDL